MRVAVLGAGAVGSLIGGSLALGGVDVTLLDVDAAQLDAINHNGLILELDAGIRTIRLPAVRPEAVTQPFDLILLITKTIHSIAALKSADKAIGPATHVLTIQNGLGNAERVASVVPRERVLFGMTTYPSTRLGAGRFASHGSGTIIFWSADGQERPVLHAVEHLFMSAGIDCHADPQVEKTIWEKVAFNTAMNSVGAITRSTVGDMADHGRELIYSIVSESCRVAHAAGVPVEEEKVLATVEMAFREHRSHRPSMLQDILAGHMTEVDAINGAMVAEGARVGVETPINAVLTRLLKIAEVAAAASKSDNLPG